MNVLDTVANDMRDVTPSDTANINAIALRVVTSGNLALETFGGGTPAAFAVTAGETIPCRVRKVKLTGTTATVIAYL